MIDFRYHLVSLAAVFIALAVGIVLGAGPLREGISDTLEGEVSQLRAERTELRGELDSAQARASARDDAVGLLGPRAVAGTLTGVRVVVVVLPGADRNIVAGLRDVADQAGATVALTAELDPGWESARSEDGQQLADELAPLLSTPEPREGDGPTLPTVLAATLLGADARGRSGAWLDAGDRLDDSGLVDLTWQDTSRPQMTDRRAPDAVLVVGGGLQADDEQTLDPATQEALETRMALADALTRLTAPLTVVGTGTGSAAGQPDGGQDLLVLGIREDTTLAEEVSTVDDAESASGRVAAILALAWELQDETGHYGLGAQAEAPVPIPPPVRLTSGLPPEDDAEVTEPVPDEESEDVPGSEETP